MHLTNVHAALRKFRKFEAGWHDDCRSRKGPDRIHQQQNVKCGVEGFSQTFMFCSIEVVDRK
jgi:hypothetical protein